MPTQTKSTLGPIPEARIRKAFRHSGEIDRKFCEQTLWWWRRLQEAIPRRPMLPPNYTPPDSHYSYLVAPRKRAGFPREVFETLQAHHELGLMAELVNRWRGAEMQARLGNVGIWPGFLDSSPGGEAQISRHARSPVVNFGPIEINLRKSKTALLREIQIALESLLRKHGLEGRAPNSSIPSRLRYFEAQSFEVLEIIDRHFLLGTPRGEQPNMIADATWSRVRRLLNA